MNIALWVGQILGAALFLLSAMTKISQPRNKLEEVLKFIEELTDGQVRIITILELLGVAGLILPAVTGILPWLTPVAAACLALMMVAATFVHLRRKEPIAITVITFIMMVFVAYGRFFLEPIS